MKSVIALGLAALTAQDTAQDWDLHRDERQKVVLAYTQFDVGVGVAVRCQDGVYVAMISGLPEAEEGAETRTLRIGFRDDEAHDSRWNVATNPAIAVAEMPAPFARSLREGGAMSTSCRGAAARAATCATTWSCRPPSRMWTRP